LLFYPTEYVSDEGGKKKRDSERKHTHTKIKYYERKNREKERDAILY